MIRFDSLGVAVGCLLAGLTASTDLLAQSKPITASDLNQSLTQLDQEAALKRIVGTINARLRADWSERGLEPAPAASDSAFVRRVYLDLIGRIPRASEVRDFLEDTHPAKRARLVDRLIRTPSFANHFASITRRDWLPQTDEDAQTFFLGVNMERWLRDRLREDTPYDQLVRQILTLPPLGPRRNRDRDLPYDFYQANNSKPEEIAATVTRAFMGIKLECAQCHDHPFAEYTQDQFWEFAAFFVDMQAGLPRPRSKSVNDYAFFREIRVPETTRMVSARLFDGTNPRWQDGTMPRELFADWLIHPDNPFFARNAANRLWAHFFGYGIIDPVDEPSPDNPPSHPEILDALAQGLIAADYDLKFLIRAITRSEAYQRSSHLTESAQQDWQRFARMNVKGLSDDQLFDSLVVATGFRDPNPEADNFYAQGTRQRFRVRFGSAERPTAMQTSILQALMLMNGDFVTAQTSLERSQNLTAIAEMPLASNAEKIDALFLNTLSRMPTSAERSRFLGYVEAGGPSGDTKKALADVFWVLLNSTEFLTNH